MDYDPDANKLSKHYLAGIWFLFVGMLRPISPICHLPMTFKQIGSRSFDGNLE
jgi:hypothetical protein